MNCIKCNASIPEGKMFCPNCGHLNDHITPKSSREVDSKITKGKRNYIALVGGILIIISLSLPFYDPHVASDEKYSMNKLTIISFRQFSLNDFIKYIFRMDEPGMVTLCRFGCAFIPFVEAILLISGGITALSALLRQKTALLFSIFTSVSCLIFLAQIYCAILLKDEIMTFYYSSPGPLVLSIGLICMLLSLNRNLKKSKAA